MTDNQIAREIIKRLRKDGEVYVGQGQLLLYGWKLREELKANGEEAHDLYGAIIELNDDTVYWWGDFVDDVDWMYLVEDGDFRSAESVHLLEERVEAYGWIIY